jgi:hypothetical protein
MQYLLVQSASEGRRLGNKFTVLLACIYNVTLFLLEVLFRKNFLMCSFMRLVTFQKNFEASCAVFIRYSVLVYIKLPSVEV